MISNRRISFVIPGRIGGKGRHRAFIRAGKIATYTPHATQSDEGVARYYASAAMRGQPPLSGALRLEVQLTRLAPISWSNKKKAAALWITGKPDCSNVLKLLEDAMNGIVYADDAQIAAIDFRRSYDVRMEQIGVTIAELEYADGND